MCLQDILWNIIVSFIVFIIVATFVAAIQNIFLDVQIKKEKLEHLRKNGFDFTIGKG